MLVRPSYYNMRGIYAQTVLTFWISLAVSYTHLSSCHTLGVHNLCSRKYVLYYNIWYDLRPTLKNLIHLVLHYLHLYTFES